MFNKNKKAFTMAEVLMVLGIIGVVAALTLPNLKDNADEQFYVAKAAKVYSELETAFSRAQLKYGENILDWGGMTTNNVGTVGTGVASKMKKYLEVTTDCGIGLNTTCWISSTTENNSAYKLELKDGTTLSFYNNTGTGSFEGNLSGISRFPGRIFLDLDGPKKGPNEMGVDIFAASYGPQKITSGIDFLDGTERSPDSLRYLAWVLKYGNEDYNRCSGLKFFGNTSCN